MKLKAVEMQGFKSFPDRTKLTFDDGITVIVGPNGSGKSNISDAIKWVFGEQSVKSLRGAKMEDIIFGGSANRKPTGFAWVSLFIDNTDRSIDVDSDEVVITRRLYRSGESEYRINNNLVRLKDINETFMDTGLGRDGYSIIEQGKIADIVSAKSTQRREIFEEAAGISKFRYRKTEAERKLDQAEENLVRLRDIMGELESRFGPLKTQAEKAKQYLTYAEEKKTLEISLWLDTLEKLRRQMKEQEDKLLIADNDKNTAQKKLDEIESTLDEIQLKTQEANSYIEHKRARIGELEESVSQAKIDTAVKQNNLEHNQSAVEQLDRELSEDSASGDDLDKKIAELTAQSADYREKLTAMENEIDGARTALEEKRREELQLAAQQQALQIQKEELQEQVHKAEISTETASSLAGETVQRLEALRDQAKNKDENLSRLKSELREHSEFAEELRDRLDGLQNSRSGYAFKLKSREEKITELESRQRGCEKLAGEKLQRAQVLSDLEKNYESFNTSVKKVMKHAEAGALRGIVGPVSSLIRTDSKYATAVEITLGGAIQNIVVQDEGAAKRAIAFLREQRAGRATFLPLTNMRSNPIRESGLSACGGYIGLASELTKCDEKYREIIGYLLGRTVVAEDIDSAAAIAKKFGYRYRVVTLDGQVVNAGGSLTGGSVNQNASILSRRGEIDSLTAEAKKITAQADEFEMQLGALRREADTIRAEIEGISAEEKTAQEDLIQASTLVKQLTSEVSDAEHLNEQAMKEYDDLTRRVEELKDQRLSSEELKNKLTGEISALTETAAAQAERRISLGQTIESGAQEISQKQIEFTALQKDADNLEETVARLTDQKNHHDTHVESLLAEREDLLRQNKQLLSDIEAIRRHTEDSGSQTEQLRRDIAETQSTLLGFERRMNELRAGEREAITAREAAANEQIRLKEKLTAYEDQQNGISSKMWEEYEMTRSDAAEAAIMLEDVPAAQKRLTELKGRIRALGSVNVSAIEEFKEVSERYYFLKEQIGDAENAKKELTKLIASLSAEMSSIFMERFSSINHHFGSIFRELFGGGHAELKLSDPADPLETGIEIFVQPPGKIIKNLSALSGGEQAFIAICIYFAILKVNPAPFVLIDEIEAALDDVNVGKFAAYLRRMTDHTQFISITHRRGTMEEGDVLYGVTMEEEGVSKLLRLKVDEMEQKFKANLN